MYISRMYTKLWTELEKSIYMGINDFVKSVILLSLHKENNWNYQSLNTTPYVGKPVGGNWKATLVINPEPDMP